MSSTYSKEERKWVLLGEKYFKEGAIVRCPNGHILNYSFQGVVNEWGHRTHCICEECPRYYGVWELEVVIFGDIVNWLFNGGI